MRKTESIHKHENTPDYEVKVLLIALRKANDITIVEMAKFIGIPKIELLEYERDSIVKTKYTAKYIEALEEYISYAPKRGRTFAEAIRVYKKQKCLHRYPISYKLTLFGNIFYDSAYVETKEYDKPVVENTFLNQTGDILIKDNDFEQEMVVFEEEEKDSVWSQEKYQKAFNILKTIRNMLELNLEDVGQALCISQTTLRIIENKFASYSGKKDLRKIVKEYAAYLDTVLEKQGVNNKVYTVICDCLSEDIDKQNKFKVIEILIKKLYE